MLSNAFAAGSNGPGTTTSTHARCQEDALRRGHATDSGRHHVITTSDRRRAGVTRVSVEPQGRRYSAPGATFPLLSRLRKSKAFQMMLLAILSFDA
ncbi:MAG: hypothetical protein QOF72_3174 [Blastocatellia bacterium]|jgi:hypothetical protein|nr:hypothetical protein [Blastocatellia bacterium]